MSTEAHRVHMVRSFTHEGSGGNPAGVFIDPKACLNERQMSSIAQSVGASETAFGRGTPPPATCEMLFFKGNGKGIPLCGHALIAAIAVITRGKIGCMEFPVRTGMGIVQCGITDKGMPWYGQNPPETVEEGKIPSAKDIASAFSYLPPYTIGSHPFRPQMLWTAPPSGLKDLLVPVAGVDYVDAARMKRGKLGELCHRHQVDGVHLFAPPASKAEQPIHVRNFSLGMTREGAGEDPATGTLAGALACVLHERRALREDVRDVLFLQGPPGHRSALRVRLVPDDDHLARAEVSGDIMHDGKMYVP